MALQLFSNNAETITASQVNPGDTSIVLASNTGALFQSPTGGNYELVTLSDGTNIEICKVTARSNDTMTVTRAQEGTSALTWNTGSSVSGRVTKGTLDNFAQSSEISSVATGDVLITANPTPSGYLLCNGSSTDYATYPTLGALLGAAIPTTWITRSAPSQKTWHAVVWANSLSIFCAAAWSGGTTSVATSSDGITWTMQTTPGTNKQWNAIAWAPEIPLFCVVASANKEIMTSPDGVTWTSRTSGSGLVYAKSFYGIAWSPTLGIFVAVSNEGNGYDVATSSNGIDWTDVAMDDGGNGLQDVCWSPELEIFCAVGYAGVYTSSNGSTWTSRTPSSSINWRTICWSSYLNLFCAVANADTGVMTSPDGITWTARTPSETGKYWTDVIWHSVCKAFFAINENSETTNVMTSPDGITWTTRTTASSNSFHTLEFNPNNGRIVAMSNAFSGTVIQTADVSSFNLPTFSGSGAAKYYIKT